ncbi:MAG: hypothetical protein NTZ65_03090 [Candidatus Berkelbacteria bacterium]|nr:hypothetical protein [Candidatus Berkelbacteria bacterium]
MQKVKSNDKIFFWIFVFLVALSFIFRLILITRPGHMGDFQTIMGWLGDANSHFRNFYVLTNANYGPLYPILTQPLIHAVNFVSRFTDFQTAGWIVDRGILYFFDAVLAYLIYKLVLIKVSKNAAYAAVLFYLLNPIIFAASSFWGQTDSLMMIFMLLAFWFLLDKKYLAVILTVGISLLIKPTLIAILPFFIIVLLLEKKFKELGIGILILAIIFYLLSAIFFGFALMAQIKFYISTLFLNNLTPRMSVGARNLWFMWGEFNSDTLTVAGFSAHLWGTLLLFLANLFAAMAYFKKKNFLSLSFAYLVVLFGFYFLPTRSHERYQIFSFLPLIFLIVSLKKWWLMGILYLVSTITFAYLILAMVPLFKVKFFEDLLANNNLGNIVVLVNLGLYLVMILMACYYSLEKNGKIKDKKI